MMKDYDVIEGTTLIIYASILYITPHYRSTYIGLSTQDNHFQNVLQFGKSCGNRMWQHGFMEDYIVYPDLCEELFWIR